MGREEQTRIALMVVVVVEASDETPKKSTSWTEYNPQPASIRYPSGLVPPVRSARREEEDGESSGPWNYRGEFPSPTIVFSTTTNIPTVGYCRCYPPCQPSPCKVNTRALMSLGFSSPLSLPLLVNARASLQQTSPTSMARIPSGAEAWYERV